MKHIKHHIIQIAKAKLQIQVVIISFCMALFHKVVGISVISSQMCQLINCCWMIRIDFSFQIALLLHLHSNENKPRRT